MIDEDAEEQYKTKTKVCRQRYIVQTSLEYLNQTRLILSYNKQRIILVRLFLMYNNPAL